MPDDRQRRDQQHRVARLRIAHPLGVTTVGVVSKPANNEMGVEFERLGFMRTARKIMDGTVYVPTSVAY